MLRTLRGHRAAVNAVQYKEDIIVSASGGNSTLINDLKKKIDVSTCGQLEPVKF